MRRLPRRLALWGGAAAIASGGFAFMATNVVGGSSAGEGTGAVSGYKVSSIHYTVTPDHYTGSTSLANFNKITFTLTSNATTTTANVAPTNVSVWFLKTGTHPWGHTEDCHSTGTWTKSTGTSGTGKFDCTTGTKIPVRTVTSIEVEANQ